MPTMLDATVDRYREKEEKNVVHRNQHKHVFKMYLVKRQNEPKRIPFLFSLSLLLLMLLVHYKFYADKKQVGVGGR